MKGPGKSEAREYESGEWLVPGTTITLNTGMSATKYRGEGRVLVRVHTTRLGAPEGAVSKPVELAMTSTTRQFLETTPGVVDFGEFKKGTPQSASAELRVHGGRAVLLKLKPMQVKFGKLRAQPEWLHVDLVPVKPDANGRSDVWRADVRLDASAPDGAGSIAVEIGCDVDIPGGNGATYGGFVRINFHPQGPLELSRDFVSFGLLKGSSPKLKAPVVRSVTVSRIDQSVDLDKLRATFVPEDGEGVSWSDSVEVLVTAGTSEDSRTIELRMPLPPDGANGAFRGKVKIETGHPEEPLLWLRFSGVARP